MRTKHTPGPWSFCTSNNGWSYTINISQAENAAYTPDWSDVAFCTCEGERKDIQEANARLIAAAPELLEALQEMVSLVEMVIPFDGPQQRKARAVIAKVTGEPQ